MDLDKFNKALNSLPLDKIIEKGKEQQELAKKDFEELKSSLSEGKCHYCNNDIAHFSDKKPCLHWLLKPNGFKKKHFPILYNNKSFHQMNAYLRWIANIESPMININDLVEEGSSNKFIEETIKYKNLEWSFSCSKNDRVGHKDKYDGTFPHYHFQMKVDGLVIINYNGFHIPFANYDEFCFGVKDEKIDRLRFRTTLGAGMQSLFDSFSSEELLDNMKNSGEDDKKQFNLQTLVEADEGTTISGDEIADMIEEHKRTGVPLAKLLRKIKNVKSTTYICPGPSVPEKATREPNRSKSDNDL
ncbi:MAG: hypothetical protein WCF94_02405 [bacterium]